MTVELWQVDAFADRPFGGNPAAVCPLDGPRDPSWYQAVAAEMNLSETAFLEPMDDGFGLRWFTPTVEVDLCGHATLASAHVLWESGRLDPGRTAHFHTRSGVLTAERDGELIVLDFPATRPVAAEEPAGLREALGVTPTEVRRSRFDLLVVLDDAARLRALAPDFVALGGLPARGVIVTAPSDTGGVDFLSRFFAPGSGVPEDPVTGSAHCALAPYWGERLGRTRLVGYQASRRGGTVRVELRGDRVRLAGRAVTVLRAELLV